MEQIAKFIFELGMLKKTPRTGFQFLGRGGENVAAHSFRTAMIAYILAKLQGQADVWRTVALALVHDLAEARTADHNYVNRRYVQVDEAKVTADQMKGLPFGPELADIKDEFEAAQTIEARLARDADQLDLIFELKEHQDLGNSYAPKWIEAATKRLTTPLAQKLASQAARTDWAEWWFNDKDPWWVHGGNNQEGT
ncbi:MAG: HD domain-containing protein [Deltaproteobacteria bacterium]|nr:HD domain-containing protein [Deltaproteobacteria bacterium]